MVRISRVLIAVAAAGLLLPGCTVKKTERPPLTGPSELALSLNLTANPDILTQDGSSQSRVVVLALDANGQPVRGVPLHLSIIGSGALSNSDISTGSDGRAAVNYTAPPAPLENVETTVTIQAVPVGTDFANAVARYVDIHLVPPGVLPPRPVAAFTFSPANPVANSPVTFDASTSQSSGGTITAYSWDFGDGSTGAGVRPQHSYRQDGDYSVVLVVTDDAGRWSYECKRTVSVGEAIPPTAEFFYSPSPAVPYQTIFFDASTSKAGAGRSIADYSWNFGNGSTQHGVTATASYTGVGTYTVTLVVTDDVGQTASTSRSVAVGTGTSSADFAATVTGTDTVNNTVNVFVDASLSKPSTGQTITSYEWIFGDGTDMVTTTTRTASHPYANPGVGKTVTYTITLTIVDSGGSRATVAKSITITGF